MKVTIVKVYDHYDSEKRNGSCYVIFVGELISEDDIFLRLRHSEVYISDNLYREEIHHILKSAIIERKDLDVEW